MRKLAHRISLLIRGGLTSLSRRFPPSTSPDMHEWTTARHRRDSWE